VDKNLLNELVSVGEKDHKIGIIGPMIYYYSSNKIDSIGAKINFWTGGFHSIGRNLIESSDGYNNLEVDFVLGCALLIKKSAIENIGILYSPYFAGWEETDWCIRAKKNGYKVVCVPRGKIWHKGGQSLSFYSPWRVYLLLRNNIIFIKRNGSILYLPTFVLFYFIIRVPVFAYGLYNSGSMKNPLKILTLIRKAVSDGITENLTR
jgi:hypothetical protein